MQKLIQIHPLDNVAVALQPLSAKERVLAGQTPLILREDIPQGHKFSLKDIPKGFQILKYGNPIGTATADIPAGSWVHTHNIKTGLSDVCEYAYTPVSPALQPFKERTFQGFRRENKKVGIRNEIWIIPTVGCVNSVAKAIETQAQCYCTKTVEAIVSYPHPYGCSQMGKDQEHTRQILADLINHPNAGGVLVLGLGCENSNIEELKKYIGPYDNRRVKFLVSQECADEIAEGVLCVKELAEYAGKCRREPIDCSELIVGLKCGGSDGLSGITANPVVGAFSDLLIGCGGTTILTEVPEMFGAETLLMNRCETEELFQKTVSLINDFKRYFTAHGQTIYENPSPGNKKGGISTLEDKSLGCTQKSGTAPVRGVLSYGEPVLEKGLHLLSAPGNDLVASTALAASGAHMVLFTTGRGTPFASPVPTMKISSNTGLYEKKQNWIDFNCGSLTEKGSVEELGMALFEKVLEIAGGAQVKAEAAGFHDMAIFKQGVTL